MQFANISQIEILDRQRKTISEAELVELKRSIAGKGLLHAPVLSAGSHPLYKLIAGERRLRAMKQLHEDGVPFTFNGEPVPLHTIPFVLISQLSEADLQEAELEENILRAPLSWLEEAEAKTKIHEMRTAKAVREGSPPPSITSTAAYITEKKGEDPASRSREVTAVHRSLMVTQHKDLPGVQAAKNLTQAYAAVLKHNENHFKAILASRKLSTENRFKLIKGNCLEELAKLPPNEFDIIFTDPPYGINADTMKHNSKHFYDDTPETALEICFTILKEGFRVTKNRATLFMWCDIDHFVLLRQQAAMQGWVPWRTPLIWFKNTHSQAPWGSAGFGRSYEVLLFAVKGQKSLYLSGGPDVFQLKNLPPSHKQHSAEKPVPVLLHLLSRACIAGDKLLDPCCGSGSIFEAAHKLRLFATGIELDQDYYNIALSRIGDLQNEALESEEDPFEVAEGEGEGEGDGEAEAS